MGRESKVSAVEGKFAFTLKIPWSDGTRVIFFSGEELVGRLAALVPPPRMHLVHSYGVLAPKAKLLLRVFGVDVLDCPDCHGRMQRIAWITQPRVIKEILNCVSQKAEPP